MSVHSQELWATLLEKLHQEGQDKALRSHLRDPALGNYQQETAASGPNRKQINLAKLSKTGKFNKNNGSC